MWSNASVADVAQLKKQRPDSDSHVPSCSLLALCYLFWPFHFFNVASVANLSCIEYAHRALCILRRAVVLYLTMFMFGTDFFRVFVLRSCPQLFAKNIFPIVGTALFNVYRIGNNWSSFLMLWVKSETNAVTKLVEEFARKSNWKNGLKIDENCSGEYSSKAN